MGKKIKDIICKPKDHFGNIVNKVNLINRIQQLLITLLEPEISKFCSVANYREGCLILEINNAAVATRLRYQLPLLLQRLRREGNLPGLVSIDFKIKLLSQEIKIERKKLTISMKSSKLLQETAKYIQNPELLAALLKLSKNTN